MSGTALDRMRSIASLRAVSGVQKAVLWALQLRADNETGECWPSLATLAADAGISKSTAKTAIRQLVAMGHVTKRGQRRLGSAEADSNIYTVHVGRELPHVGREIPRQGQQLPQGETEGAPRVGRESAGGEAAAGYKLITELPKGTANGTGRVLTGDTPRSPKGLKRAEDEATGELFSLKVHYMTAYSVSHAGEEARFTKDGAASWPKAMTALRELLELCGSLESARRRVTTHFEDAWKARNRCQPWEILADINKATLPTAIRSARNGTPQRDPIEGSAWISALATKGTST